MRFAIALDERSDGDSDVPVSGIAFIIDSFTLTLLRDDELVIRYQPERDSFMVATRHLRASSC